MRSKELGSKSSRSVDEENPYWISFSDIMSGLLVIFILATTMLVLDLMETKTKVDKAIEELQKLNEVRREILNQIQIELEKDGIRVEVADNGSVLRVPSDQLSFESGKDYIPQGKDFAVNRIGQAVSAAISRDQRYKLINTIFIEGHTDGARVKGGIYKGNWGLSAHRAITVWEHWKNNPQYGKALTELYNDEGRPIFSVSGYAATRRLIEPEIKASDFMQNRRIDVRFTMKSPKLMELEAISSMIEGKS